MSLQLTATLRAADQSVLTDRTVTWASEDEAIATITGMGVVSTLASGAVRLIATSEGISGGTDLTVIPPPSPVASVSLSSLPDDLDPGVTAQLTVTLRDGQGVVLTGRPVTWSSSAPEVATVSSAGLVTARRPGSFVISAESEAQSSEAVSAVRTLAFSQVFASNAYSCGLTTVQRLYCWGSNSGQFGNGSTGSSLVPVLSGMGERYIALSANRDYYSGYFICGIRSGGSLFCWGDNFNGQLGDGTLTDRDTPGLVLGGQQFSVVSAGTTFACGVTTAGAAYCWGSDHAGQLGNGTAPASKTPVQVSGGLTFRTLSAGDTHVCGLTTSGTAYCWGSNAEGELGTGTLVSSDVPVPVSGMLGFASISAGGGYTCGITLTQVAYCWGSDGGWGALGTGLHADVNVPTPVAGGLAFSVLETTGFGSPTTHTCGVTTSGDAYCWGWQALGDGIGNATLVPSLVAGGHVWSTVAPGAAHSCGVISAGSAYCWGENIAGNLGTGSSPGEPVPAKVAYQP